MSSYSVVDCWEVHGSRSESFDVQGSPTASVTLRCLAVNAHALVADLLGNQRPYPFGLGPVYPRASSAGILASVESATTVGQCLVYNELEVQVGYSVGNDNLYSESLVPDVEFRTLDYRYFRWGSSTGDALIEAEAPGTPVRRMALQRTIFNLQSIPINVLTLPGSCNATAYVSNTLGLTFPPETLLFGTPRFNRTISTSGNNAWTVDLTFPIKEEGWNRFWRHKTQSYDRIYLYNGQEYKNFPPRNFQDWLF